MHQLTNQGFESPYKHYNIASLTHDIWDIVRSCYEWIFDPTRSQSDERLGIKSTFQRQ